jgi:cob(I)alamin adenosyltransferase
MANRLTTITTRTGDDGTTGLGDGSRVNKDHARIEAMGDVDELNSQMGLLLTEPMSSEIASLLTDIQHDLFDLGGELSIPGFELLKSEQVQRLDEAIVRWNESLPRLAEFILPGGARASAQAHVCRTIARRAERKVVALNASTPAVRAEVMQYLNRLSDLLFVLARVFNRSPECDGPGEDMLWQRQRS